VQTHNFCFPVNYFFMFMSYLFIIMVDNIMRTATKGAENLGLTITKRQSQRFPATYLTDTDFADDIALLSDNINSLRLMHSMQSNNTVVLFN